MDLVRLKSLLIQDEGVRQFPYQDSVGKTTIGIGRNLSDVGLNPAEIHFLFCNDVETAQKVLDTLIPSWHAFEEPRQAVFLGLAFNLGPKLALFTHLLTYANARNWEGCGHALTQSLWWKQVGTRGPRYQHMLLTAEWPAVSKFTDTFPPPHLAV